MNMTKEQLPWTQTAEEALKLRLRMIHADLSAAMRNANAAELGSNVLGPMNDALNDVESVIAVLP